MNMIENELKGLLKNNQSGHNLYVLFASTPCKMGKFIRFMTKHRYNHVAISFDDQLQKLYSFSRHYENAPFYGGFVEESFRRYHDKDKLCMIKVCKIPLSIEEKNKIMRFLICIEKNSKMYVYNFISALIFPIKRRIRVQKAYTCIEFILAVVKKSSVGVELKKRNFVSIKELEKILGDKVVYEGSSTHYPIPGDWGNDLFPKKMEAFSYYHITMVNLGKLLKRIVV